MASKKISPTQKPITTTNVSIKDVVGYLESEAWRKTEENQKWIVLEGTDDAEGHPLEVILPRDENSKDYNVYLKSLLDLLSDISNDTPQTILGRIKNFTKDIFRVRNIREDTDSIPIKLAAKQINSLKLVIGFSALSEKEPKPFFGSQSSAMKGAIEHYRFGHTFAGSFGYTIESPLRSEPIFIQLRLKLQDQVENEIQLPLERRIMERIVRGLAITQKAVKERDVNVLVNSYGSGFNANMCDAIANMFDEENTSIEYSVSWSRKIAPSSDVSVSDVRVGERERNVLREASQKLRQLEPEYTTITGLVIGLSSSDDPLESKNAKRLVILDGSRPGTSRRHRIKVFLDKEDYVQANEAHMGWKTVSVEGVLQNLGYSWQLSDTRNFRILR